MQLILPNKGNFEWFFYFLVRLHTFIVTTIIVVHDTKEKILQGYETT